MAKSAKKLNVEDTHETEKSSKLLKKKEHTEKIDLENDDLDKFDATTRQALKDLSTAPDYYKIIGAAPTDSQNAIKTMCREKLMLYHADKLPPNLDLKEKKKYETYYNLVYEAQNILKDPKKRKYYDLQRKTIHNKDFAKQKSTFKDFIKLQESEISDQSRESAQLKYDLAQEQLNKKHNFKSKDAQLPGMQKQETDKKLQDLMLQRDSQDCEYQPRNKFEGRSFDIRDFNRNWEKMKKHEAKKGKNKDTDTSVIQWEGIGAANDVGLGGNENFISVDNDYEDIYSTNKINSTNYSSVLSDNSEEESVSSAETNSDIDVDYVTNFDKNRDAGDLERRMNEFTNTRMTELNDQKDEKVTGNGYWKDVMNNPFNVSNQMGTMVGDDVKTISFGNKNRNKISKDRVEAYKHLVYENDKDKEN